MSEIEKTFQLFGGGNLGVSEKKSLKFIFDELDADMKGNKLLDQNKKTHNNWFFIFCGDSS